MKRKLTLLPALLLIIITGFLFYTTQAYAGTYLDFDKFKELVKYQNQISIYSAIRNSDTTTEWIDKTREITVNAKNNGGVINLDNGVAGLKREALQGYFYKPSSVYEEKSYGVLCEQYALWNVNEESVQNTIDANARIAAKTIIQNKALNEENVKYSIYDTYSNSFIGGIPTFDINQNYTVTGVYNQILDKIKAKNIDISGIYDICKSYKNDFDPSSADFNKGGMWKDQFSEKPADQDTAICWVWMSNVIWNKTKDCILPTNEIDSIANDFENFIKGIKNEDLDAINTALTPLYGVKTDVANQKSQKAKSVPFWNDEGLASANETYDLPSFNKNSLLVGNVLSWSGVYTPNLNDYNNYTQIGIDTLYGVAARSLRYLGEVPGFLGNNGQTTDGDLKDYPRINKSNYKPGINNDVYTRIWGVDPGQVIGFKSENAGGWLDGDKEKTSGIGDLHAKNLEQSRNDFLDMLIGIFTDLPSAFLDMINALIGAILNLVIAFANFNLNDFLKDVGLGKVSDAVTDTFIANTQTHQMSIVMVIAIIAFMITIVSVLIRRVKGDASAREAIKEVVILCTTITLAGVVMLGGVSVIQDTLIDASTTIIDDVQSSITDQNDNNTAVFQYYKDGKIDRGKTEKGLVTKIYIDTVIEDEFGYSSSQLNLTNDNWNNNGTQKGYNVNRIISSIFNGNKATEDDAAAHTFEISNGISTCNNLGYFWYCSMSTVNTANPFTINDDGSAQLNNNNSVYNNILISDFLAATDSYCGGNSKCNAIMEHMFSPHRNPLNLLLVILVNCTLIFALLILAAYLLVSTLIFNIVTVILPIIPILLLVKPMRENAKKLVYTWLGCFLKMTVAGVLVVLIIYLSAILCESFAGKVIDIVLLVIVGMQMPKLMSKISSITDKHGIDGMKNADRFINNNLAKPYNALGRKASSKLSAGARAVRNSVKNRGAKKDSQSLSEQSDVELYDKDGNRIDQYGNRIDENGNVINDGDVSNSTEVNNSSNEDIKKLQELENKFFNGEEISYEDARKLLENGIITAEQLEMAVDSGQITGLKNSGIAKRYVRAAKAFESSKNASDKSRRLKFIQSLADRNAEKKLANFNDFSNKTKHEQFTEKFSKVISDAKNVIKEKAEDVYDVAYDYTKGNFDRGKVAFNNVKANIEHNKFAKQTMHDAQDKVKDMTIKEQETAVKGRKTIVDTVGGEDEYIDAYGKEMDRSLNLKTNKQINQNKDKIMKDAQKVIDENAPKKQEYKSRREQRKEVRASKDKKAEYPKKVDPQVQLRQQNKQSKSGNDNNFIE